ncbi:MAG: virulence-associated E family protein [Desulfobulbaceae bacterium]|nr:virulence-associated E family protein [Desulfobulbaceae bacterium]
MISKSPFSPTPKDFPQVPIEPKKIQVGHSFRSTPPTPPATIVSSKLLSEWRGSVTTFKGFTGTILEKELKDASWKDISNLLCPSKPSILPVKEKGQYFVPCLLKEAALVGKTLETAKSNGTSTIGKMRSKSHVTEASMLVMDVDGLPEADVIVALDTIKADGITYLAYTTHSQGNIMKPGLRARLVILLDRLVTTEEYAEVWHGFDKKYFNGEVSKADSSGVKMYQQQGTWCCHPSRVDKAKSWRYDGGIASSDKLIELGRVNEAPHVSVEESLLPQETNVTTRNSFPPSDANKIADKCPQIGTFRNGKGADQSEPHWFDCIGIVGHCQGGEKVCQEWSSGYSGYDKTETEKKIAHRLKTPPTTCDQFRKTNPAGCDGCTQSCKSPITLGHDKTDALASIQQQFGLLNLQGKICVFDRESLDARTDQGIAEKLNLSNRNDGKLLIERALEEQHPGADAKEILKKFWKNPNTVCYKGVEFNPEYTSRNCLNLWVGPTIIPKAGQWLVIKAFLLDVLCDGDQEAFDYLLKYVAHALQCPSEKPGVMIILLGGQGTGKGTLGRILQKIWSATYVQVNNIDSVTGSFNASLERSFIVFMDEALFSGNRRGSDALKSLVTEPLLQINEKFQPARQIRSYHRFFAATNADHFKNTEHDDRRDFTLRLSESRKGDHAYWNELNNEVNNGGVEAMTDDLLAMDLSSFNVRNKPNTKELLEQKMLSLDPIARWWHDCLDSGYISMKTQYVNVERHPYEDESKWPDFVGTKEAIEGISEISGGRMHRKPSSIDVVQQMKKLCPSAKKKQKQTKHDRRRGLSLPSLQQARFEFEQFIGGTLQWPEEIENAGTTGGHSDSSVAEF